MLQLGLGLGLGTGNGYFHSFFFFFVKVTNTFVLSSWPRLSLGTRPSKNRKGGSGTSAGVEMYTAPGMKAHFRLAFD